MDNGGYFDEVKKNQYVSLVRLRMSFMTASVFVVRFAFTWEDSNDRK